MLQAGAMYQYCRAEAAVEGTRGSTSMGGGCSNRDSEEVDVVGVLAG